MKFKISEQKSEPTWTKGEPTTNTNQVQSYFNTSWVNCEFNWTTLNLLDSCFPYYQSSPTLLEPPWTTSNLFDPPWAYWIEPWIWIKSELESRVNLLLTLILIKSNHTWTKPNPAWIKGETWSILNLLAPPRPPLNLPLTFLKVWDYLTEGWSYLNQEYTYLNEECTYLNHVWADRNRVWTYLNWLWTYLNWRWIYLNEAWIY